MLGYFKIQDKNSSSLCFLPVSILTFLSRPLQHLIMLSEGERRTDRKLSRTTLQMLHNNVLISITYISHPHYLRPPNHPQKRFNGAVEELSAFNMSSLLCMTDSPLCFKQILPITNEITVIFRLAPRECRAENRIETIKKWSENEGTEQEGKKGDVTASTRQPIGGGESQRRSRRGCVFLALQHQQ